MSREDRAVVNHRLVLIDAIGAGFVEQKHSGIIGRSEQGKLTRLFHYEFTGADLLVLEIQNVVLSLGDELLVSFRHFLQQSDESTVILRPLENCRSER